jgi:hypothetical protein
MSKQLRERDLVIDRWVRANKVFPYRTRPHMIDVQLYFLKLFGCMLCEAKATGHDLGIDIGTFSSAIMTGTPHPEVFLQFGKGDGIVGRSNLHAWKTQQGSLLAAWLYQLDSVAISVVFAQAGRWEHSDGIWHPHAPTSSKRFKIADFMYEQRAAEKTDAQEEP